MSLLGIIGSFSRGGYTNPPLQTDPSYVSISTPDKETVAYSDAPILLSNSMIDENGEIHITGKKIQELGNLGYCIDTSNLSVRAKIFVEGCILSSPGMPIFGYNYRHDWVIRNNFFFGVRGMASPRTSWGRWIRINDPYSCIIENNYFEDMGGFKVELSSASHLNPDGFKFRFNKGKNVYQPDGLMNFVNVKGTGGVTVGGMEICWNELYNDPDLVAIEDTINIYTVKAPVDSPARIHNNFLDGAHNGKTDTSYSGGGIILDGKGENNASDCNENWIIEDNQLIRQCNYQIGIALATNSKIRNNRCIVAAKFEDGTSYYSWTSGIWTDDYSTNDDVTANIEVSGNVVGARNGSSGRMDYGYYPEGQTHTTAFDNTSLPEPLTRELEDAEYLIWQNKLDTNDYIVGPKQLNN